MGRTAKYTGAIVDEINGYIARGMTQREICKRVGVSTCTFYNMQKKGLLAYSTHFRPGKTKVNDSVKLPELLDSQRLDGTPKLDDLPYKDHHDYDLPFDDIEDEEAEKEPEQKEGSKILIKTEQLVTISGPYHKIEIENNMAKIKFSIVNDGITIGKVRGMLDDMIAELKEMKLELSARMY